MRTVALALFVLGACRDEGVGPRPNNDPTVNMVIFAVGDQKLVSSGATRSDTSIQVAWHDLDSDMRAQPADVRELYSEWEPSESDRAFIARTFPGAKVGFTFSRLREAKQAIDEAR